ncbi:MAG TPA: universal stress protein [Casimicrobiaceae bacterium]|nr:universal stress protein [Casimicrobiaceae bacterium]
MTIKAILVHIDDRSGCEQRIELAARLAKRLGSRLDGLYLVAAYRASEDDDRLLPPVELAKHMSEKEARQRGEALFRRIAASATLADVGFEVVDGDAIDAGIPEIRCSDLTIIGQPDMQSNRAGASRHLAENAVIGGGAPILLVPDKGVHTDSGSHVIIAWDGGREAARSVRDALQLMQRADRVTVVSWVDRHDMTQDGTRSHARLGGYLLAHGIEAQFKRLHGAAAEVGERLLSQAADIGADLIVMGGYGHARLRELVLGGATRQILETMTVPVLMSH